MTITKLVTMFALVGATTAFGSDVPTQRLAPGSLHGEVDAISFGAAKLSGDRGDPISVVHVRETFINRSDKVPWVIDTSTAGLWIGGTAPVVHPTFVNSDAPTLPLLIVGRGEHRVADLYFAVPNADDLPYFLVTYRVVTVETRYEGHVMLGRTNHWPTRDERGAEPGWGHHWWADPTYPWSQYYHRPGYVVPRPPRHVDVIRSPRDYYQEIPSVPSDVAMTTWPRTDECNEW